MRRPSRRSVLAAAIAAALGGAPPSAAAPAAPAAHRPENAFQLACQRLVGGRPAAVVAVDPASGRLRALVHPELANRPTPPGSIFKLVTALAAMETGAGGPGRTWTCRGWLRAPGAGGRPEMMSCWKPEGHGTLNLEGALAASCNLYFVALGREAGAPALARAAARCGLEGGEHVDPRDAQVAIGEGLGWQMTAMQAASMVSAILMGGGRFQPAWRPGMAVGPALGPAADLARLRTGMRGAVVSGSAVRAKVPGLQVAGKTGTGVYRDGSNRTHGWFAGWATAGKKRLAIAVLIDDANGFGDATLLAKGVLTAWRDARTP